MLQHANQHTHTKIVCILPINYQFGMNIYTFSTAKKVSHTQRTTTTKKVIFSVGVCVCLYSIYFIVIVVDFVCVFEMNFYLLNDWEKTVNKYE